MKIDRGKCILTEHLPVLTWFTGQEGGNACQCPLTSMCKKKWEENFLPLSVKMLYPSKEKWQGRLLLPPSLVWATRAKGSSHNKYFCKVRRALSMSHIRNLPLNAFLHQPWNIHALCKVFMWTSVQVSPWGKSAEKLKGSTHPFSVVLMSLAYWTLEVVTNDLSRQDKKKQPETSLVSQPTIWLLLHGITGCRV